MGSIALKQNGHSIRVAILFWCPGEKSFPRNFLAVAAEISGHRTRDTAYSPRDRESVQVLSAKLRFALGTNEKIPFRDFFIGAQERT
jgi:hypothetical protein